MSSTSVPNSSSMMDRLSDCGFDAMSPQPTRSDSLLPNCDCGRIHELCSVPPRRDRAPAIRRPSHNRQPSGPLSASAADRQMRSDSRDSVAQSLNYLHPMRFDDAIPNSHWAF
jgi:hypothetical protein